MKCALPPGPDTRPLTAAKKNKPALVVLMLFVLSVPTMVLLIRNCSMKRIRSAPADPHAWLAIPLIGVQLVGILRSFEYDQEMYTELGFVCPLCHKPLHEAQNGICVNGPCPRCRKPSLLTMVHRSR